MRKTVAVLALTFLALASGAFAADLQTSGKAAKDRLPAELLAEIFNSKQPVVESNSCYDQVYQDCMTFCYELSQTNGCDSFATQQCLCWRYPTDCPVCY
jgi:hypothetical protein